MYRSAQSSWNLSQSGSSVSGDLQLPLYAGAAVVLHCQGRGFRGCQREGEFCVCIINTLDGVPESAFEVITRNLWVLFLLEIFINLIHNRNQCRFYQCRMHLL